MAFHNSKEEVIKIQLTQFGKNCLARGVFKPVYYQFFDDGILYNSLNGGVSEIQNDTETRILKNTPYLQPQHVQQSVETQYIIEDELIKSGSADRFKSLQRNLNPDIQDAILFYPLGEQESSIEKYARFSVTSLDSMFTTGTVEYITGSSMNRKIPQIPSHPEYNITVESSENSTGQKTSEEFKDLLSNNITFEDGANINIHPQDFVIDMQELNTTYGLENFEVEVYQVLKDGTEDVLRRIRDLNDLNVFFNIKTDEDVDLSKHNIKTMKQTNYRKREES